MPTPGFRCRWHTGTGHHQRPCESPVLPSRERAEA